jgi:hypothetical protein
MSTAAEDIKKYGGEECPHCGSWVRASDEARAFHARRCATKKGTPNVR